MIERNGRSASNEYSSAFAFSMRSMERLVKSGHGLADAFLVEGLLVLGAAIGVCLVAVLIRAGW